MKRIIFSLAIVITTIMIMSSCSDDSALVVNTANSKNSSSVTEISLNINSGIDVSEESSTFSNSSAVKASTRSTTSTSTNFSAKLPPQFTAYFVAAEATSEYTQGAIVRKISVSTGNNNNISVPAIKYHIYVTNYDPANAPTADKNSNQESAVKALENSLPENTTTLYLYGTNDADFSSTTSTANATVTLTNYYAAVCVANNGHVKSVSYKDGTETTNYALDSTNQWYYMYVKAPTDGTTSNTDFTVTVENLAGIPDGREYTFSEEVTADNIYQYTVNEKGGLIITVNAFEGVKPTTTHYHVDSNSGNLIKDN